MYIFVCARKQIPLQVFLLFKGFLVPIKSLAQENPAQIFSHQQFVPRLGVATGSNNSNFKTSRFIDSRFIRIYFASLGNPSFGNNLILPRSQSYKEYSP